MTMSGPADPTWLIGHHDQSESSLGCAQLVDQGYDLVTVRITNDAFQQHVLGLVDRAHAELPEFDVAIDQMPLIPLLTPMYTNLMPDQCAPYFLAQVSPWIDLASSDPIIAHMSRQVFQQEIAFASFCGLTNIIIDGSLFDHASNIPAAGRAIAHELANGPFLQLHLALPMCPESEASGSTDRDILHNRKSKAHRHAPKPNTEHELRIWHTWDVIRSICAYSSRLDILLKLSDQLPPPALRSRWYSEPVRILEIPAEIFAPTGAGRPVLPIFTQQDLTRFMRLKQPPWILLSGTGSTWQREDELLTDSPSEYPTPAEATAFIRRNDTSPSQNPYLASMRQLQLEQPPRPAIDQHYAGFQDYLQSPLQPLADNLESVTYEVFEKDPIKYEWYERAIAAALRGLYETLRRPLVVAVVGAGRGPLVTRVLNAAKSTAVPVEAHAVEKNPNAYVLLLHKNATDALWNGKVTVTKTDMRSWEGPNDGSRKVDILVSELLGSFGDNELSPECLDGVQHVLARGHGISIPQSYTAHLTPVAHPTVHADLAARSGDAKWSLPYVALLDQLDYLCLRPLEEGPRGTTDFAKPDVQVAWEFKHPVPIEVLLQSARRRGGATAGPGSAGGDGWNEHNARSCSLSFRSANSGVCHGLAGYFETVLYESTLRPERKVELSINPNTIDDKSKDMISWFPIFFPLKAPLQVPEGAEIRVTMFRQTDDRKVWYEWLVEVYVNINGHKQRCGASELHSSSKYGCLI